MFYCLLFGWLFLYRCYHALLNSMGNATEMIDSRIIWHFLFFGRTIDAIGISTRYQLPPKREHHWIGPEHVAPGILHSMAHEYVENLCVCVCFSLFFGRYIAASHIIVNDTVFQMNYTTVTQTAIDFYLQKHIFQTEFSQIGILPMHFFFQFDGMQLIKRKLKLCSSPFENAKPNFWHQNSPTFFEDSLAGAFIFKFQASFASESSCFFISPLVSNNTK